MKTAAFTLLTAAWLLALCAPLPAAQPPNIILILADDLGETNDLADAKPARARPMTKWIRR